MKGLNGWKSTFIALPVFLDNEANECLRKPIMMKHKLMKKYSLAHEA